MSVHNTSTHVRPANTAAWRAGTFVRRFLQTHERVYTRMPSCAAGGPYPGVGLDGLLLVTPKHSGVLSLKQTGAEHSAQKHGGSLGHAPRDSCAVTKSTPARRTALLGRAALMSTPVHRKPRSPRSRSCARAPQRVARVHHLNGGVRELHGVGRVHPTMCRDRSLRGSHYHMLPGPLIAVFVTTTV